MIGAQIAVEDFFVVSDPVTQPADRVERIVHDLAFRPARAMGKSFVERLAPNLILVLRAEQSHPEREGQFCNNGTVGWFVVIDLGNRLLMSSI